MRRFIPAVSFAAAALPALAGGPFPPVATEAVKRECSECHVLY